MAHCSSWGHTESDTTQGLSNSNNKEWTGSPTGTWKVALFPLHRDAAVFLVWILKEEAHPNLRRNEELAVTALEVKAVGGISRPLTYWVKHPGHGNTRTAGADCKEHAKCPRGVARYSQLWLWRNSLAMTATGNWYGETSYSSTCRNCSVAVMSNSLQPHELHHSSLPCLSLFPRACSNTCPLSWWCHPTISSSAATFSSCPSSFPVSGSFPMTQFFASGDQSIGDSASATVLPMMNDWNDSGLISISNDWFDLLAFEGTLKNLL